ncbi:hypothetical protein ID866_10390 [Astraeus odoratus]|nr:hypothetical protein ID866_10390 [Astraeus odoratus]
MSGHSGLIGFLGITVNNPYLRNCSDMLAYSYVCPEGLTSTPGQARPQTNHLLSARGRGGAMVDRLRTKASMTRLGMRNISGAYTTPNSTFRNTLLTSRTRCAHQMNHVLVISPVPFSMDGPR